MKYQKLIFLLAVIFGTITMLVSCGNCNDSAASDTTKGSSTPPIATGIEVKGLPESGILEYHIGTSPDLSGLSVRVLFSDGTAKEVPMTEKMLIDFDPTLESQVVTVQFNNLTTTINMRVMLRTELIDAFEAACAALADKNSLKRSDLPALREVNSAYNALTAREIEAADTKAKNDFFAMLTAMDRVLGSIYLTDAPLVMRDTFTTKSYDWKATFITNIAEWQSRNGVLFADQLTYHDNGTSYLVYNKKYSRIDGVTCDARLSSDGTFVGLCVGIHDIGFYYPRINISSSGKLRAELYQYRNGAMQRLGYADLTADSHSNESWYNLAIYFKNDNVCFAVDGKTVCVISANGDDKYNSGGVGFRVIRGNGEFDNFTVYGVEAEEPASVPTTFTDSFSDETIGASPNYWIESVDRDDWKVASIGNKSAYGTAATDSLSQTWLHGFSKDPIFKSSLYVKANTPNGQVGIAVRMNIDTAFLMAGYDFKEGKWFIFATQGPDFPTQKFYSPSASFGLETWYELELIAIGNSATLKVNGSTVIEANGTIAHNCKGRAALFANGVEAYFTDITYVMTEGSHVQDGLIEYTILPNTFHNCAEIEEAPNGHLVLVANKDVLISTDKGLTFTNKNASAYADSRYGGYSTIIKLHDGKYIRVLSDMQIDQSNDLKNWTKLSSIIPASELKDSYGNIVAIYHVNTATEIKLSNGTYRLFIPLAFRKYNANGSIIGHNTRIFYSDNGGMSWSESQNSVKDIYPDYDDNTSWAESKVVNCTDGTLRLYYTRNKVGHIAYTESHNNGVSWTGFYTYDEFACSMSSFAVYPDPKDPSIWYMVFVNNPPYVNGLIYPRSHLVLMRSENGKDWSEVLDLDFVEEVGITGKSHNIYQFIDPSLYINDDYVYITYGRSLAADESAHNQQRIAYIRIDREKLDM